LESGSQLAPGAQGPITPWNAQYSPFDYLNPNSDNEPAVIKSGYKAEPGGNGNAIAPKKNENEVLKFLKGYFFDN